MKEHILSPQSCKMANHTCQITREDSIKFWKRPNDCGGSCCCGSPGGQLHMPVPHGCTHRTRTGEDISLWPNLPKPSLSGPARLHQAGEDTGHFPPQCLTPSGFALLGVSLLLVLPKISQCLLFFLSVSFASMQTPYCCRHHCQGLRHPPGALPEQSNATIQAPPGWDCGSCSALGRGGLQQAEGGQVLHSRPSLPPCEIEDRNENLGCLAG